MRQNYYDPRDREVWSGRHHHGPGKKVLSATENLPSKRTNYCDLQYLVPRKLGWLLVVVCAARVTRVIIAG